MKKGLARKTFTFEGKRYEVCAKTKAEALEKMIEKKRRLEMGSERICSSMQVAKWIDQCIDTYKTNLRPNSMKAYRELMKCAITDHIGHMRLRDITPVKCQEVLNLQAGKSKSQISKVYQMLQFVFNKAVENKLLIENPAAYIVRPQGTKRSRRALSAYEQSCIRKALEKHEKPLYFLFMLECGCRPSEAASIEGRDIVTKNGRDYLHIRGTKSAAADRFVPLNDNIRRYLPSHPDPFKLLCTTGAGNKINAQAHRRAWSSLVRLVNIEMGCKVYRNEVLPPYRFDEAITPYYLRHTFCTNLKKAGIDIRTAQYLMGHSDIKMTANIYTHTDEEDLPDIWDTLNKDTSAAPKRTTLSIVAG